MNQERDYMWRNKILTNNKICISRTFDATDSMVEVKINKWLDKFTIEDGEDPENIIIQKTISEEDFKILSPTQPILIIINDGVSTLFVPVIEYAK